MPDRDPQDQREFYRRRMLEELGRAERAENDGLRHLHYSWASAYRRKLEALPGSNAPPKHPAGARGLGSWETDLG
jgi:hypothetical protein